MRITTGSAKGRPIALPKGMQLRPSTDRLRLALFNILGPGITGASFLDLFCGTGAVALEALSRGAGKAIFCDSQRRCIEHAKALAEKFKFQPERSEFLQGPFERTLASLAGRGLSFDYVFIDPPYEAGLVEPALRLLVGLAIVAPGPHARVLVERATSSKPPQVEGLVLLKDHAYGSSSLAVYEAAAP